MRFSIPTNWQLDLIDKIDIRFVNDFYGKLACDWAGGGRPSYLLAPISRKKARRHIDNIHSKGLKFNYLINSTCMGNAEFTRQGRAELDSLLNWISDMRVDTVTVAIPHILEIIKKNYPDIKVSVSSFANVNTPQRAKFWQDIGADEITLMPVDVNRDFELLASIRRSVECKLQLIVNNNCISGCPMYFYHANMLSHASQSQHKSKGFFIDYCRASCRHMRLKEPVNFIKADWIRPEDIGAYSKIGIDKFKLVDRSLQTQALQKIADSYFRGSHEGNLLDLFPNSRDHIVFNRSSFFHKLKFFFRPDCVNVFKLYRMKKLLSNTDIYIDNKSLDGFISDLAGKKCRTTSCAACGYCYAVSSKTVKFNDALLSKSKGDYSEFLNSINKGEIYR